MKKTTLLIVVFVLVLSIGSIAVFARESSRRESFIDQNGDGICDNRSSCQGQNLVDTNGDGICDNQGDHHDKGHGHCRN